MTSTGRDVLIGGMSVALALVLPPFFHALGLGSAFLPMFYPILAAGFMTSFSVAAAVGFLSPLASAVLTGMPPFYPPLAFVMAAEGIILGGATSFLRRTAHWGIPTTLAVVLLADRCLLLAMSTVIAQWMTLPADFLGWASILRGLPGIAAIFVLLPPLIRELDKLVKAAPVME